MTNKDKVLNYLKSISPGTATNNKIVAATGIRPHQQVFQITSKLEKLGTIKGRMFGNEWDYWFEQSLTENHGLPAQLVTPLPDPTRELTPMGFEEHAKLLLEIHYRKAFQQGSVVGVPKRWDYLSVDKSIVGDAKLYTMVGGERTPPAKMSIIAEHVWLLCHIPAVTRFLVFGGDKRVPSLWLQRYGHLVDGVTFWFVDAEGSHLNLTPLN